MKRNEFKGDKKLPIISLTGSLERQLIEATIHKIPRWIEGYHLTLMTIVWSAGLIFFGYLAQWNRHWLWCSSLMVFLQWFTDSYDGALGRLRDTGIPKWGYYMDHFLDYIFLCAVFIGYSFLLHQENLRGLFVLLTIFTAFMLNSYLSFAATNEFKITFLGFGPTEIRILFMLFNTYLIFFGSEFVEKHIQYIIPMVLIVLTIVVFRTQKYIWNIDMNEKQARHEHKERTEE
ncbi:putative phosphatidyltransferase [Candidatus Vecturithrix granuli]|uniref:Putative phosphatidyltransferase n=1 Tax=Vecturithrix granuli TaxID=1499967 RepID=A0A081BVC2_VECG1|nr:putative phosphatidyltransferase [Candidatus Vecturithrix granuli]